MSFVMAHSMWWSRTWSWNPKRPGWMFSAWPKSTSRTPPPSWLPRMAKLRPRKQHCKAGRTTSSKSPSIWMCFGNLVQRAAETSQLRQQNQGLKEDLDAVDHFHGIVGQSQGMREVIESIRRVAASNLPVLITGESGTGKELVAAAIHVMSPRASQRYVTFNAAGQSESLLEDELFGHVRGAYTGAERDREGVFEYADKGTLFDEIGDMPMGMQSRLLRVLESGEIVRLGANDPRETDVRFVAATNRDLKQDIRTAISARTFITEFGALRSISQPCGSVVKTFLCWFVTSCGNGLLKLAAPSHGSMTLPCFVWWPGTGRERA